MTKDYYLTQHQMQVFAENLLYYVEQMTSAKTTHEFTATVTEVFNFCLEFDEGFDCLELVKKDVG